ncbi:MAG: hypothetical protein IH619_06270 [Ignavibacterium sp.]|nr:hypothetical protein [Ignavibacterium sp.]
MTRRMKLIFTRSADDSLEAFENFRRITALKSTHSKKSLIKDELVNEWEKFWECINKTQNRKTCLSNYPN